MKKLWIILTTIILSPLGGVGGGSAYAQQTVTITCNNGTRMVVDIENVQDITFGEREALVGNQFAIDDEVYDITSATKKVIEDKTLYTLSSADESISVMIPTGQFGQEITLGQEGCQASVSLGGRQLVLASGTLKVSKPKTSDNIIISLNATNGMARYRISYNGECGSEHEVTNTYRLNINGDMTGSLTGGVFRMVDKQKLSTSFVFGTKLDPEGLAELKSGMYTVEVRLLTSQVGKSLDLATQKELYAITVYDNEAGCLHTKGQAIAYSDITGTLETANEGGKAYLKLSAKLDSQKLIEADFFGEVTDVESLDPILPAEPSGAEVNGAWVEIPSTHEMLFQKQGFAKVFMKENYNKTKRTFTFLLNETDTQYTSGLPKFTVAIASEETLMEQDEFDLKDCPEDSWNYTISNIDIYAVTQDQYKAPYAPNDGIIQYSINTENKTFHLILKATDPSTKELVKICYDGTYE